MVVVSVQLMRWFMYVGFCILFYKIILLIAVFLDLVLFWITTLFASFGSITLCPICHQDCSHLEPKINIVQLSLL